MQRTRQLRLAYSIIAGVLAAIGAVVLLLVGTGFVNPENARGSATFSRSAAHVTLSEFIILVVIISGFIVAAGLLATGSYWRTKKTAADIAHENARRQREAVEKTLKRLRERMSLPGLFEQNRLMLTDYHEIATEHAQKSFKSSQRAMFGGFSWLLACFTAVIFTQSVDGKIILAAMAPAGSALAAFLNRTYLLVYERATVQLGQYYNQPLLNSYYLSAERLANDMPDGAKDKLISDVVGQLLKVAGSLNEDPAHADGTRRKPRGKVPRMRPASAGEDGGKDQPVTTGPAG